MSKGSSCFYCEHHCNGRIESPGWSYDCSKGIDNSKMDNGPDDVLKCQNSSPQFGFQIGGYYTHMTLKGDDCLEWKIKSDGEFPTENESEMINFHICEFDQIKKFVEFWDNIINKEQP